MSQQAQKRIAARRRLLSALVLRNKDCAYIQRNEWYIGLEGRRRYDVFRKADNSPRGARLIAGTACPDARRDTSGRRALGAKRVPAGRGRAYKALAFSLPGGRRLAWQTRASLSASI